VIKLTLAVTVGLLILWFKWAMVNPLIRIPVSVVVGVVATIVIGVLGQSSH
jgi:hypothetical protein